MSHNLLLTGCITTQLTINQTVKLSLRNLDRVKITKTGLWLDNFKLIISITSLLLAFTLYIAKHSVVVKGNEYVSTVHSKMRQTSSWVRSKENNCVVWGQISVLSATLGNAIYSGACRNATAVAHVDDHELEKELDAERRRLTSTVTTLSICSATVEQRKITDYRRQQWEADQQW